MGAATVGVGWSGYFVSLLDYFGIHLPAALTSAPLRFCSAADVANAVAACIHPGWNPTGALFNLPGDGDRAAGDHHPRDRHRGVGQGQQPDRHPQDRRGGALHHLRLPATSTRTTGIRSSRPTPAPSASSAGAACSAGAGLIFFAYIGFDAVSTAAQEARNPQKRHADRHPRLARHLHHPLHPGVAHADRAGADTTGSTWPHPVAFAVEQVQQLSWLRPFITIGAVLGLGSVVLVMLLGQSRVFYSMSRDGLHRPVGGQGAPPLPDAVPLHDLRRPHRRGHHRHLSHPDPGRAGQHRHAAGLRAGVRRRVDPAEDKRPDLERPVPDAAGAAGARSSASWRASASWPRCRATPGSGCSCGC